MKTQDNSPSGTEQVDAEAHVQQTGDRNTGTPMIWRVAILVAIGLIASGAYVGQQFIGLRGQSAAGIVCFFGIVAASSRNLRAVNWKTIGWGVCLQVVLAVLVLKGKVTWGGSEYSVYQAFEGAGDVVKAFVSFSDQGAEFVFGNASRPDHLSRVFGQDFLFPFAFKALPPILFISAFFTLLYHFGILQA